MNRTEKLIISLLLILLAIIGFWVYQRYDPFDKIGKNEEVLQPEIETTGIPGYYLAAAEGDITDEVEEYRSSWRIHFFNVGQGDAVLIQDENLNILIDGGDNNSGIVDELKILAVDTLHWVIATHPHADHIAGLIDVLQTFPVLNVLDPGVDHTSRVYSNYHELVNARALSYTRGFAGWSCSLANDFSMEVLHPDTLTQNDINNSSLVLRMQMGDTYALFTGDAEHEAEKAILARGLDIDSDIIKVGHHGSKTSSSNDFIAAVSPEWGVILCGEDNKYNFPHTEALAVYQANQTKLFQSDKHGDVLFLISDSTYEAFPEFTTPFVPDLLATPVRVNINRAGIDSLVLIVNVGEITARRIIDNRPYTSLDDLERVKGLGPARIAAIKEQGVAMITN